MAKVPALDEQIIEQAAHVLGEAGTGSDITQIFQRIGLNDNSGESTKWRRIHAVLCNAQRQNGVAVKFFCFIKQMLAPVRFRNNPAQLKKLIEDLNEILVFAGFQMEESGKFVAVAKVKTVSEAQKRAMSMRRKLIDHGAHSETLKYCTEELMENDAFHAVLESCKGIFARIRTMTGLKGDGHKLIDDAFGGDKPLLALNSLRTETEKSEQTGLIFLLKGCVSACRNPRAHEPRILWAGTDDEALDGFALVSMLHRQLDKCVHTF